MIEFIPPLPFWLIKTPHVLASHTILHIITPCFTFPSHLAASFCHFFFQNSGTGTKWTTDHGFRPGGASYDFFIAALNLIEPNVPTVPTSA